MSFSKHAMARLRDCATAGVSLVLAMSVSVAALAQDAPAKKSEDAACCEAEKAKKPRVKTPEDRIRDKIPNYVMYTQTGEQVRLYDDLVKDKIVMVYFFFTTCEGICPATTANLCAIADLLGDRMGKEFFIIGLTLDPETDDPKALAEYAKLYDVGPGWTFVTGVKDEIEKVRFNLGVYDPDPIVDADLYSHAGLITFGNEKNGRMAALPGTINPEQIVEAMLRITKRERWKPPAKKEAGE